MSTCIWPLQSLAAEGQLGAIGMIPNNREKSQDHHRGRTAVTSTIGPPYMLLKGSAHRVNTRKDAEPVNAHCQQQKTRVDSWECLSNIHAIRMQSPAPSASSTFTSTVSLDCRGLAHLPRHFDITGMPKGGQPCTSGGMLGPKYTTRNG